MSVRATALATRHAQSSVVDHRACFGLPVRVPIASPRTYSLPHLATLEARLSALRCPVHIGPGTVPLTHNAQVSGSIPLSGSPRVLVEGLNPPGRVSPSLSSPRPWFEPCGGMPSQGPRRGSGLLFQGPPQVNLTSVKIGGWYG